MSYESIQLLMHYLKLDHTAPCISEMVADAIRSKSNHMDFFEKILTAEYQAREESRIATSLKISGLPRGMHLDNFDYLFQPSVDKAKIDMLSTCEFIRNHENILLFGPPGVGNYRKFLFMESNVIKSLKNHNSYFVFFS
jgi:DNA replication protein DnaC